MLRLVLGATTALGIASALAFTACGGNGDAAPSAADAGTTDAASTGNDAGSDVGSDAAATLLVKGQATLFGLTSDDIAIYVSDDSGNTNVFHTLDLAGGAPTALASYDLNYSQMHGDVAFLGDQTHVDVWTHAHGRQRVSTREDNFLWFAASTDAEMAMFLEPNALQYYHDVYVVNTDGTGKTKVATTYASCNIFTAFAGDYAVTVACPPPDALDGGAGDGGDAGGSAVFAGTLQAFAKGTHAKTQEVPDLSISELPIVDDHHGGQLLVPTTGGLMLFSAAGGAGTLLDATSVNGIFINGGDDVLYITKTGAVMRTPVTGLSPTTLVASSNFNHAIGVSPDGQWVLLAQYTGSKMPEAILSLGAPSSPRTLTQCGQLGGSMFTADSSFVIYGADCGTTTTFVAEPVAGGDAVTLGKSAFAPQSVAGSGVFFDTNYQQDSFGNVLARDVMFRNATSAGASTLLVSSATAYHPTHAGDRLLYSWGMIDSTSDDKGLWVMPVR